MKKVLTIFLSLITISLFFTHFAFAQTPTPDLPIPGVTCGNLNGSCCYYDPVAFTPLKTGIGPIDDILTLINDSLSGIAGNIIAPINKVSQEMVQPCIAGIVPSTPGDPADPNCICVEPTIAPLDKLKELCDNIQNASEKSQCINCLSGSGGFASVGVWTGMGCIYSDLKTFISSTLLGWGVGLAGVVALLCIVYSAFQMQLSQGNPEKIKKAQELLTSCIMGLVLIIFSVFILRLIGVNILRIPGFS